MRNECQVKESLSRVSRNNMRSLFLTHSFIWNLRVW